MSEQKQSQCDCKAWTPEFCYFSREPLDDDGYTKGMKCPFLLIEQLQRQLKDHEDSAPIYDKEREKLETLIKEQKATIEWLRERLKAKQWMLEKTQEYRDAFIDHIIAIKKAIGLHESDHINKVMRQIEALSTELIKPKEQPGMYTREQLLKQCRACASCSPNKPQKCDVCPQNFHLRKKGRNDEW